MLGLLAKIMLSTVLIDLTIGFIWIGLIGFREMVCSYKQTFPKGNIIENFIRSKIKQFNEDNSYEECEYMKEHKSVIEQLEEVYGKNEDN